ncbi:MAG: alpha/beta hydrolase [Shewanella sp.]|uniref:alpha/beta hydrolase n=1 Tax=Shewanella sp. SNU WT4 TaxID=2590015 RepID=UPI00112DA747|nr:dienelactone hydrolase family protein [Shewanella sp. SNU WT4]QDF66819.1 carboxylesterase [Shewanella sp. SNU WT4]
MSVSQLTPALSGIVVEPAQAATACVIWLHGLGDSADGFAPIVKSLQLPKNSSIRFIFPNAPEQAVTINAGYIMRAWYDIKSLDLHDRADMAGVMASEQLLDELIGQQIAAGIASDKILIAGFSQGGVMALFTALRCSSKLAGILALSCYLPGGDELPQACSSANQNTPIVYQHGEQDDVVIPMAADMARQALTAGGYPLDFSWYPVGHSLCAQQIMPIREFILNRLMA